MGAYKKALPLGGEGLECEQGVLTPASRSLDLRQELHQSLALAIGLPVTMAVATATTATMAVTFARATTSCSRCCDNGGLGFLALGDADVLGNFVDVLSVIHRPLVLPLVHRHGELFFHSLSVHWPRVVGAEWIDQAVWRGVVDDAPFNALHFVIVGVHEVHAAGHEKLIALAPSGAVFRSAFDKFF
jgi:hypothetical protein